MEDRIIISGAREHNLKNVSLSIPKNKLVVFTGLSGSGKSSLAFDTIYAEGQRRYVESLSAYARLFLEQLQKPEVDDIRGLSPAIAIEQKTASRNPRSTVGTQTEIYDYLRVLFARAGRVHCYKCGRLISSRSVQEIVKTLLSSSRGEEIHILAPVIGGKKGAHKDVLEKVRKSGFSRIRADGRIYEAPFSVRMDRYKLHTIEVVVDRLNIGQENSARLTDSLETAFKIGSGVLIIYRPEAGKEDLYSRHYACVHCGISYQEMEPRTFSFNSPYGACPDCNGLGIKLEFDPGLIIPDQGKSIEDGAIEVWKRGGRGYILYYRWLLRELSSALGFSLKTPFNKLPRGVRKALLYGTEVRVGGKPFEGIIPHLTRLFSKSDSDYLKEEISRFMSSQPCPACGGARLKKESLFVLVGGMNISGVCGLTVREARDFFSRLELGQQEKTIAAQPLKEIMKRLQFCVDVGLDYLTLERKSSTLSGGEAQRIRLATQVGSGLTGVLYVLDEPSIGLHQRDNAKLLATLCSLRDLGNTLVVVEHDEATIRAADYLVDLGPGAGREGGGVVFAGTPGELLERGKSLTARYLRGEMSIPCPPERRKLSSGRCLRVKGAREHNLKNIDVDFPLGVFICLTGVSGSGKSTLVEDILYRGLAAAFHGAKERPGAHKGIYGMGHIDKVVVVDQAPIGRTPRSNPCTYTGVFDDIRMLFSSLPEARMRGYRPGRFSFNVSGGRCEACSGDGVKKIEMHFLPDVYLKCDVCGGKRFNEATLAVRYKGRSIADVLEMTVEEALDFFSNIPRIRNVLHTLNEVGLGYIHLGQSATTLSGGEAQRMKLSAELSKKATGRTFYILDEPTTGLHFADVARLVAVLQKLVEMGNTVLVVEHNLDVIKNADYIIDLGPEGGDGGGEVVACGTPEEIAANPRSHTGIFLRRILPGS
ncbi:MAG: excinuclease ABC subunit UvrA [Elusimicrobia bacterium]|nr:excinuclease ABC subunit UvrA [Elusimicrobiota bacterium]